MKYLLSLITFILFNTFAYSQSDIAKAMIELDNRLTNYEILKIDTQFYDSGKTKKIRFYNPLNKIRKSITFFETGKVKDIFNTNAKGELDGLSLELFESGEIKHYGIYSNEAGFSYDYYENGRIKQYYQTKDTYPIGYQSSFCSKGELYYEAFHDSLDYIQKGYHCNGNLRFKGRMLNEVEEGELGYRVLNQKKDGKWEYWNEEGILIEEEFWEKGVLISRKKYDEKGVFIKEEKINGGSYKLKW